MAYIHRSSFAEILSMVCAIRGYFEKFNIPFVVAAEMPIDIIVDESGLHFAIIQEKR